MKSLILLGSWFPLMYFAQQGLVPTSSYFRDRLFESQHLIHHTDSVSISPGYNGSCFLPELEKSYNLHQEIRDRSSQYSDFTERLFKKHAVETQGKDAKIFISPVGEFSLGKELRDTSVNYLYKNSRGIQIQGDLFKNFSFQTAFYENQARLSSFERDFINQHGEYYTQSAGYSQQNGVVPGAARTKPFKTTGYDYAFAVGHFVYSPTKQLSIVAGNNQQFIGSGYRSLIYGNHHVGTPYVRTKFSFLKRWEWNFFRTRSMNLVRKKTYSTVEGYYQPKTIGINYLTWHPTQKLTINFAESTVWKMGDSLTTRSAHPLVFSPIPFSSRLLSKETAFSLYALTFDWLLWNSLRAYGQLITPFNGTFAGQLGLRISPNIPVRTLIQLEYNYVSKSMYQATDRLINHSNYNLPVAHIMGNGFQEFLLRIQGEYKRVYAALNTHFFLLTDYSHYNLQAIAYLPSTVNGSLLNNKLEIGYRFNQKLNVNIFGQCVLRKEWWEQGKSNMVFQMGIRTGLIDGINDF